jgi:hypothetical protein
MTSATRECPKLDQKLAASTTLSAMRQEAVPLLFHDESAVVTPLHIIGHYMKLPPDTLHIVTIPYPGRYCYHSAAYCHVMKLSSLFGRQQINSER